MNSFLQIEHCRGEKDREALKPPDAEQQMNAAKDLKLKSPNPTLLPLKTT